MENNATFWVLATIACLTVQGFYSMMEMACVSFNKVRLQYHISKNHAGARRLHYLLKHPARLFGTTLIGVNAALQLGSECSRRVYEASGYSPDLAPITQVFLVLIFAELVPMFAARRYSEHVAMGGVRVLYATSLVMRPVIAFIGLLSSWINRLFGSRNVAANSFLSREELQNLIEEQDDAEQAPAESEDFNRVVANMFSVRNRTAKQLMDRLDSVALLPSNATVGRLRHVLEQSKDRWAAIFHRDSHNVIGIAHPRDFLRLPDHRQAREVARPPWFITETMRVLPLLQQFRRNNQSVAVVLNKSGQAVGLLTLDTIMDDLFGAVGAESVLAQQGVLPQTKAIERSFPGETKNIGVQSAVWHQAQVRGRRNPHRAHARGTWSTARARRHCAHRCLRIQST